MCQCGRESRVIEKCDRYQQGSEKNHTNKVKQLSLKLTSEMQLGLNPDSQYRWWDLNRKKPFSNFIKKLELSLEFLTFNTTYNMQTAYTLKYTEKG